MDEMTEMTELETRLKQLEQREKDLAARELKVLARRTLADKGLDTELAELADCSGEEQCVKSIERLEEAILKEVTRRLDRRGPDKTGSLPGADRAPSDDELSDREYYARRFK